MSNPTANLWRLNELTFEVAKSLASDYAPPENGQVRAVPDVRTIRYYTTLGLIDRPAAMQGRTALYGWRHLLQLVAIKRLQASGLALVEIQSRLLGRSDAELAAVANLPMQNPQASAGSTADQQATRFWKKAPVPVEMPAPGQAQRVDRPAPGPWQGIELAAGLLLLFEPQRQIEEGELLAIQESASAIIRLLESRQLWRSERRE
jgi:DNA-binding transcriptional MerR regulator